MASKRVFDDFDATVGMGGPLRLQLPHFPNPLGYLLTPSRHGPESMEPGKLISGSFPWPQSRPVRRRGCEPIKTSFVAEEYSSDRYLSETARRNFHPRTQVNIGANYQLLNSLQVGVAWL